tara:strand:+ start:4976 stop:5182 length:207 start_codon:yes stop_codon:yes gene_type:complete
MKNKEFEEVVENLANKAKLAEYNDLAIVLYTYLGSKKVGMGSEFARYCQTFAKEGVKEIEMHMNRRNN